MKTLVFTVVLLESLLSLPLHAEEETAATRIKRLPPRQRFIYAIRNSFDFFNKNAQTLKYFDTGFVVKKTGEKNLLNEKLSAYILSGLYYSSFAQYEKAANKYLTGLKTIEELELNRKEDFTAGQLKEVKLFKGDFLFALSRVYIEIKSYKLADTLLNSSFETYRNLQDTIGMALTYNEMGHSALSQKKIDESLDFFQKALSLYKAVNDSAGIVNEYNNIGIAYISAGNYEESKHFFERALSVCRKKNNKTQEARVLFNLGILQSYLNDYDKKLDYLLKAYKILDSLNIPLGKTKVLENIAQYYFVKKNYELSEEYLNKALVIARKNNFGNHMLFIYKNYSTLFSQQNDFKKAFYYQNLYEKAQDSIIVKNRQAINKLMLKYQSEQTEKMKGFLMREKRISKLLSEREQNIKKFTVIFSLLIVIIVIVLLSRYRLKIKTSKQLAKKNNALKTANTLQKKFFSILGHDLKNPLGTSKALSEMLLENYSRLTDEQKKKTLNSLVKSTNASYLLTENLLLWSQLQNDKIIFQKENILFSDSLKEVLSLLATQIEEKSITIKTEVPRELYLFTDKNMLHLVLRNLLSNAIKFSCPGQTVTVKATEGDTSVSISVIDNGIGIDKPDLDKLFNNTGNINTSATTKNKGTGLGLMICKEFVEKTGGKIFVKSVKGIETVFTFTIPKP